VKENRWIVVRNWPKYQHYADRHPVWIKLYTELAHRDDWCGLTLAQRGLLVSIWIEYALKDGQLNTSEVPARILQKLPRNSLEALRDAGFIRFRASKPLAASRARAREVEVEKKPPSPPSKNDRPRKRITGWREVRGSHGRTFVPDPAGTDPAPKGFAEMPELRPL